MLTKQEEQPLIAEAEDIYLFIGFGNKMPQDIDRMFTFLKQPGREQSWIIAISKDNLNDADDYKKSAKFFADNRILIMSHELGATNGPKSWEKISGLVGNNPKIHTVICDSHGMVKVYIDPIIDGILAFIEYDQDQSTVSKLFSEDVSIYLPNSAYFFDVKRHRETAL